MTTITYRDGIIAADSRMSDGKAFVIRDDIPKLYKLSDGAALGLGGHHYNGLVLLKAMQTLLKRKEEKTLPEGKYKGVEAILVSPNGDVYWFEQNCWDVLTEPYTAIGSGWKYAIAAMDAGASAVEAVKVSIKRDPFSGGKIQKVKVF